jgi:hypothetical protein
MLTGLRRQHEGETSNTNVPLPIYIRLIFQQPRASTKLALRFKSPDSKYVWLATWLTRRIVSSSSIVSANSLSHNCRRRSLLKLSIIIDNQSAIVCQIAQTSGFEQLA